MSATNTDHSEKELYVAGIGASAGALDPLKQLVINLPNGEINLCLVIVQHIAEDYHSKLEAILTLPKGWAIKIASKKEKLMPGQIYITPGGHDVVTKGNQLTLLQQNSRPNAMPSIDTFFESIAKEKGARSIGVILSGTGEDGAQGIKAIKDKGGLTICQDPKEAQYGSMPKAALATHQVDLNIPAALIGTEIESFIKNFNVVENHKSTESSQQSILRMLTSSSGTDFSLYKSNTITRRINKRIEALDLNNIDNYLSYIHNTPNELNRLYETILIGVTEFFRDQSSFEKLEEFLRKLVDRKKPGDSIRIWSVGCASGEEPYSLAILMNEILDDDIGRYNVQIFATDIDSRALSAARKGLYKPEQLKNVPEELLEKYFIPSSGTYELRKSIKQHVLFSKHDITLDPPFVRLDLVSCRNLLIYFNADLQKEVLPLFHYSLNTNGLLFLGKSENTSGLTDLFEEVEKKAKLFTNHDNADISKLSYSHFRRSANRSHKEAIPPQPKLSLEEIAAETIVKRYDHPYVVVGENLQVHLIKGSLKPYLDLGEGSVSSNLLKILHKDLHTELRTCFNHVKREKENCFSNIIRFHEGEKDQYLKLHMKPLMYTKNEKRYYLIVFERIEVDERFFMPDHVLQQDNQSQVIHIMELEQELDATREHLQAFTEELETGNEELQSMNEELQSANEELKSANEELETSNEELQSANEELQTANSELGLTNQALIAKENELLAAKEELEITTERFEMALSSSTIFIAYQDKDLRYYWCHNAAPGFEVPFINGQTDQQLLGSDGKEVIELKQEVIIKGKERTKEVKFRERFWEMTSKPIFKKSTVVGVKTVAYDITERKQAVEEKARRQDIIEGIIENSIDQMIVLDPEYYILALNQAQVNEFKRRFSKSPKEGENVLQFLKHEEKVKERFTKLFGRAFDGETVLIEKYHSTEEITTGNPRYYNLNISPILDNQNKVFAASLISRDITDSVLSEEQIQYVIKHTANLTHDEFFVDLTEQLNNLFRAKYVYFATFDESKETLHTHAYRINGKIAENFSYKVLHTPCDAVKSTQEFKHFTHVLDDFNKDPKLAKWEALDYVGIPVTSPPTGELLGVFVMTHDEVIPMVEDSDYLFNVLALRAGAEIENAQNTRKIQARDVQLENITQNVPEMIYEYLSGSDTEDDSFTFVSPAVKQIYEITVEELLENPQLAWDSIYEDDFQGFITEMDRCTKTLEKFMWTGRIVGHKTYKLRWVKITSKPEKLSNGSIKWHGIVDDISRIKQIEQELVYAKQLAEKSAEAKEEFLATMSHEIRTPLNGIVGITDIMLSEAKPDQMEYLNLLKFSAENLMTLINNILDFSKLNAGKIDVSESNIHLKVLLKNLRHAHSYRARENGNELNFIVDEGIPDMVRGDDMILLQILNNLIGNAVKFTKDGKVELVLSMIKKKPRGVTIKFEVRDTGVGIAEHDLKKIFEKFEQVGERSQNSGGTGLGLAISKKLLEILGADLQVKSELGQGTTFYFTLTLKKAFFDRKSDSYAENELTLPEMEKPLKLLLVEDVEENKNLLLRYFHKSRQLKADAASNGKEAIEMLLENDYDIVLMDLRMPVMDGRTATAEIRSWENEKYRKLPIIALTADTFSLEDEKDFTDVITKPFSPRELRSKILEYLDTPKE